MRRPHSDGALAVGAAAEGSRTLTFMNESSAPPTQSRGAKDAGGADAPHPAGPGAPAPAQGTSETNAREGAHSQAHEGHGFRVWRMTRPLVLATSVLCVSVFWGVGNLLHIPVHAGYEASLLQQPGLSGKVLAVVMAGALFVACTLGAHLLAGRRWVLAGPFAAALGLAAWSVRGGPSVYVYKYAATTGQGPAVFPMLVLELLLLFAVVGGIWWLLVRRLEALAAEAAKAPAPLPAPPATAAKEKPKANVKSKPYEPTLVGRIQGLLTQVAIIGSIMLLLTATPDKSQVLASVLIASLVGTGLAEHYFKEEKLDRWLWAGPLIVGALGYLLTWLTGDPVVATQTGRVMGTFAPLARPLPLDYASFGTAGALLGYWMAADVPRLAARGLPLAFGLELFPRKTSLAAAPPGSDNGQVG
jgi:hypothetical protein